MMQLLDEIDKIEMCFENISTKVNVFKNATSLAILRDIKQAQNAINNIKTISMQLSENTTLSANGLSQDKGKGPKSVHIRKRKLLVHAEKCNIPEVDPLSIKSSLKALFREGKLTRPVDVCKVILGDDSPAYKRKRGEIYELLSSEFNIAKLGTLRNCFTRYKKYLCNKGPPLPEQFGSRGHVLMPQSLFLLKLSHEYTTLENRHQNDLRGIVKKILTDHMNPSQSQGEISHITIAAPSRSAISVYSRIATASNVAQIHLSKIICQSSNTESSPCTIATSDAIVFDELQNLVPRNTFNSQTGSIEPVVPLPTLNQPSNPTMTIQPPYPPLTPSAVQVMHSLASDELQNLIPRNTFNSQTGSIEPVVPLPTLNQPSNPTMTIQPPYPPLTPSAVQVMHSLARSKNIRCLNVRQPWASLLVEGIKTIENRSSGVNKPYFTERMNLGDNCNGEWVLIVASLRQPTKAVLTQALNDFRNRYGTVGELKFGQFKQRHTSNWPLGCIVGAVRFNLLLTAQFIATRQEDLSHMLKPSALRWYRGPPYEGWHVCDAIAFNKPIQNIPGALSISNISKKGREIEQRIRNNLSNL